MTSDLINTVYLSEKRKQVLLMLMHKPATIETIKEALTGTRSNQARSKLTGMMAQSRTRAVSQCLIHSRTLVSI